MSDQDKAARAAKAKASREANAAKRTQALYALLGELRPRHPELDQPELEILAGIELRRRALDAQRERVLNPRVNAKAQTRRKILVGAVVMTAMDRDPSVKDLVRRLLAAASGGLKDGDRKVLSDLLDVPEPAPTPRPAPVPDAARLQPQAPAAPRPMTPTAPPTNPQPGGM